MRRIALVFGTLTLLGLMALPASAEGGFFSMEASVYGSWIHGQEWDGDLIPGNDAHVVVTDVDGATELLDTTVPVTAKDPGPGGEFSVDSPFPLQPGMTITATASGITKVLTLVHLTIDSIDRETGVVTGTGPAGLPAGEGSQTLHVDTDLSPDPRGYVSAWPGTDGDGNWTVNFGEALVPGADTGADINDEDWDATIFDLMVPDPRFVVNISTGEDGQGQYMNGWGGWVGPVAISLDGTQIATVPTEEGGFGWYDEFDAIRFSPGDTVGVIDAAGNEKSLVLANLAVTSIDAGVGYVTGTCDAAMDVHLEYSTDDAHPNPTQLVVACNDGTFEGFFAPYELPNYPEGSYVEARQWDDDGDLTQVDAWYPGYDTGDIYDPYIEITAPENLAVYTLGETVLADYACTDTESGVATCVGGVPDGAAIDTGSVGTKTFRVDATDNAGHDADLTYTYTVAYDFTGFFRPVDNPPTLNSVKAGQAIPVTFSLDGNFGLDTITIGSSNMACSSGDVDAIEVTVVAGASSLSYDPLTDTYTYVWKTTKTWGGTCRQLYVTLADGTSHLATFRFTK